MTIPQILITPPWQDKASRIKAPKIPETLNISELPKLFVKDDPVPLSDDKVANLLGLLFKSDMKQWVEPLTDDSVRALIAAFEPDSLRDFAHALAQQVGMDWYGYAVLSPFDFATVEQFRGYIDGKTARTEDSPILFDKKATQTIFAKQLIRLLAINFRMTGSPHALQTLFLQQQKGKKTYRNFCLDTLNNLALDMGLSLMELQDLAVPDFGFVHGKRTVKLGEHELQLRLDPHFQILIYQDNTLIKNLPKIGKTDNKEQWKQTVDEIKSQQKQLNKLSRELPKIIQPELKYQYYRQFSHFRDNYLNHPVLNQVAQTLVWAVFETVTDGDKTYKQFRQAFLPSNDGSWLNSEYDDIKPIIEDMVASDMDKFVVAPLHPAYISESEQQAFADMLMDFEIIQPCPQLSIQAYRATDDEWQTGAITRFENVDLYRGGIGDLYYRYSFDELRNEKGEWIGFKAIYRQNDEALSVYFTANLDYSNSRFQVQPIKLDKTTNKFLLNNALEILTEAENALKR